MRSGGEIWMWYPYPFVDANAHGPLRLSVDHDPSAISFGLLEQAAQILAGPMDLDERVAGLAARLDDIAPADDAAPRAYQPSPSPRFCKLDGQAREEAIARLRAWVEVRVQDPCSYQTLADS
jgi:hypothetical protein